MFIERDSKTPPKLRQERHVKITPNVCVTMIHMPLLTELADLLVALIYKHDTPTGFYKELGRAANTHTKRKATGEGGTGHEEGKATYLDW